MPSRINRRTTAAIPTHNQIFLLPPFFDCPSVLLSFAVWSSYCPSSSPEASE